MFSFVDRRRYSAMTDTPGATSCCRVTDIRSSNLRCRSGCGLRAEPPPTPLANEASAVGPISQSCTMLSPSVPYGLAQAAVRSQPGAPIGILLPGISATSNQSRSSVRAAAPA